MSEASSSHLKDILTLMAVALVALPVIFLLYTAVTATTNIHALLYSGCRGERDSLADRGYDAEPVMITSREGIQLNGWFTSGHQHPDVAIVVLPGQGSNTCYALPEAALLADAGYSTLVFEHRTCADPMLPSTTGAYEANDLLGAVDYLVSRADVERIGVLGFAEGGTASILAAAQEPRIEAVVAVGSYASLEDEILDPQGDLRWYERLQRRFMLFSIKREGIEYEQIRPVDVVRDIGPRPLLLIHGGCDEADGLSLASAANPSSTELWVVPTAGRGGLAQFDADAYRERIVFFFDVAFGLTSVEASPTSTKGKQPWATEPLDAP